MTIQITNANPTDLAQIARIQAACYGADFIEDSQAFAAKLHASPDTCWLAHIEQQAIGYLVSVPVSLNTLPTLNAASFEMALDADLLYLHDLAIHPDFRASGAGKQLIQHFKQYAQHTTHFNFKGMLLIAVQDSATYWQRHGFEQLNELSDFLAQKVASFGDDAVLMHAALT